MAFRGYLKEGLYYIIGWALGSVILVSFGVITSSIFYDSLIIPSAVIIVKIIFILIKKRKNNSVAIKRHSP